MTGKPRRVAVLGATSAIAEACARELAARGDHLFLAARRPEELAAMADDLKVRGAAAVSTWCGDLADLGRHKELARSLKEAMAAPDIVLLAWGTLPDAARTLADPAYAADELRVNFTAPAALLLALAPLVPRAVAGSPGGTIACITSVAGDRGRQSNFVYGSAKGGLQRFLEGLRHRLHGDGVAVLDIRPGFVKSPMTAHLEGGGPLWATPERVAADIVRAIDRGRAVLYTPWFWRWIMLIVTALPRPLLHRTRL